MRSAPLLTARATNTPAATAACDNLLVVTWKRRDQPGRKRAGWGKSRKRHGKHELRVPLAPAPEVRGPKSRQCCHSEKTCPAPSIIGISASHAFIAPFPFPTPPALPPPLLHPRPSHCFAVPEPREPRPPTHLPGFLPLSGRGRVSWVLKRCASQARTDGWTDGRERNRTIPDGTGRTHGRNGRDVTRWAGKPEADSCSRQRAHCVLEASNGPRICSPGGGFQYELFIEISKIGSEEVRRGLRMRKTREIQRVGHQFERAELRCM